MVPPRITQIVFQTNDSIRGFLHVQRVPQDGATVWPGRARDVFGRRDFAGPAVRYDGVSEITGSGLRPWTVGGKTAQTHRRGNGTGTR